MPQMHHELSEEEIKAILTSTPYMKNMSEASLTNLIEEVSFINLEAGETLINEGQYGNCLYIILIGRLQVSKVVDGEDVIFNELGSGEIVGIHSVIANVKCSATIKAIRETLVFPLTQKIFQKYIMTNPETLLDISKIGIEQALNNTEYTHSRSAKTIVVIPGGTFKGSAQLIKQLEPIINHYGSIITIDEAHVKREMGIAEDQYIDTELSNKIYSYLDELEVKYDYIILLASPELTPWCRLCILHAERILNLCDTESSSDLNSTEMAIYSEWANIYAIKEVVLLHSPDKKYPKNCNEWFLQRKFDRYYHIRKNHALDLGKLTRIMTGNAIALVLSGGGAKGLAYIGLIKAMEELNIKVDFVAGSSIGALFSSLIAMEKSYQELIEICHEIFDHKKAAIDVTLPFSALLSGKKVNKLLIRVFGDELYSNELWIKNLITTTNLSTGQLEIAADDLVWRNVRASVSIPGIFPPVIKENNAILVDGAVLNNLPVDLMSQYMHDEGKIIASYIVSNQQYKKYNNTSGELSGGKMLRKRFTPFSKKKLELPNIYYTISRSMFIEGLIHQKAMLAKANYVIPINPTNNHILDFQNYQEITDYGYQVGLKSFRDIFKQLRRDTES